MSEQGAQMLNQELPGRLGSARRAQAETLLGSGLSTEAGCSEASTGESTSGQELHRLLTSESADRNVVRQLVEDLIQQPSSFDEDLIGNGPWIVRYAEGPAPWLATLNASRRLSFRENQASQELEPGCRRLVSKVQLLGDAVYVTAEGSYEPLETAEGKAQRVEAKVRSTFLHIRGSRLPLPIRGTGLQEVCYLDSQLRIFRDPSFGTVSVQVRADTLTPRSE